MKIVELICRGIDAINFWVGRIVSWVTLLVVLVVFVDVVIRYAFNTSYVFTQELEWHLFSFIFLMGAGYTLLKDGHVRVDIFYQRMHPINDYKGLKMRIPGLGGKVVAKGRRDCGLAARR